MVMTCEDIGSKVMSLCVAREMVVPMAMEAKAAREVVVTNIVMIIVDFMVLIIIMVIIVINQHCHDYC